MVGYGTGVAGITTGWGKSDIDPTRNLAVCEDHRLLDGLSRLIDHVNLRRLVEIATSRIHARRGRAQKRHRVRYVVHF